MQYKTIYILYILKNILADCGAPINKRNYNLCIEVHISEINLESWRFTHGNKNGNMKNAVRNR